jgi:hypothetical protein
MSDVITVPSHTKRTTRKLPSNPVRAFSDATGSLRSHSEWPETAGDR